MRGVVLGTAIGILAAGCFTPSLDPCALQCAAGNVCPPGTMCLGDGFCHDSAQDALCAIDDFDAATFDAAPDAGADARVCPTACGDGVIENVMGEACDDGNCASDDGCSAVCEEEQFFICSGEPSTCRGQPITPGDLVITEIFINPEPPIGEAEGEWFEIFNPTSTEWDLFGVHVRDLPPAGMITFEDFEVDINLPIAPGQTLLFASSGDMAKNGGIAPDFVWDSDDFRLANGTDEVRITARDSTTVLDGVDYNGANFPDAPAVSMSLDKDLYDALLNDDGANWCDGQALFGTGDGLGSPRNINPDCP